MAALVALAPGRPVGEVRAGLRASARDAAERVFQASVLHRARRRRGAGGRRREQDGRRLFRRLDRLPALRRRVPRSDGAVLRTALGRRGAPQDPLEQLRAALQHRYAGGHAILSTSHTEGRLTWLTRTRPISTKG